MNSINPKPPLQISWSELPPDLLLPIAKRLVTQPDIFSFRRVCKLWRASAPLSLLASKNILSPLFPHRFTTIKTDDRYLPKSNIVCMNCVILLRSNINPELPPFIITVDEYNSGKLYVRRPFYAHPFKYFPYFDDTNILTRDFPRSLDLSRFRVLELARFPTLSYVMDGTTPYVALLSRNYYARRKVVLFADPNCENRATINDYTLVELASQSRDLILKRLRNGERHKFTYKYKNMERRLIDLVNFKGQVYVIDNYHRVLSIDYHSMEVSKIVKSLRSERMCDKKFMFVSCDELYAVSMWSKQKEESVEFSVFKLNEKERKWDKLKGIGDDKILFLTYDGSFVASTNDFPGCKGNCIIFFRLMMQNGCITCITMLYHHNDYEIYVFDFDGGDSGPIASYPGYSDVVVWPPPSWLYGNDSGSS